MIDFKSFYEKLDNILNEISKEQTRINYLFTILSALEKTFGKAIRIANGRIYKAQLEEYVLIHPELNIQNKFLPNLNQSFIFRITERI